MTRFKMLQVVLSVVALVLVSGVQIGTVQAGPKEEVAKIDQDIADLRAEIQNDERAIRKINQAVEESRAKGLKDNTLSFDKELNAKGLQGQGAVGDGKKKPKIVQDTINALENDLGALGRFNPKAELLYGKSRVLVERGREYKKMAKKRKAELGLGEDDELPESEKARMVEIANQRALYVVEALRSGVSQKTMQARIARLEKRRAELMKQLSPSEQAKANQERKAKEAASAVNSDEPQTASTEDEPKAPEPKRPQYDATNLKATFAVLGGRAQSLNSALKAVGLACSALGSKQDVDARAAKLKSDGLSLPSSLKTNLAFDTALMNRLDAILAELRRLETDVAANKNAACTAAQKDVPDLESIRTFAGGTQRAGDRATDLRAQAEKIAAKLASNLLAADRMPNEEQLNAQLKKQQAFARHQCEEPKYQYDRTLPAIDAAQNQLEEKANQASRHLAEAHSHGYEDADVYQQRLAEISALRAKSTAAHQQLTSCKEVRAHIDTSCGELDRALGAEAHSLTMSYIQQIYNQDTLPTKQLAQMKTVMDKIRKATARTYLSTLEADKCVGIAETKPPKGPDPKTVAEAAGLANLAGASCDVSDLDQRIGQLKTPRFADVPGLDQTVAALEAKRSAIHAANARFNDAKANFGAGDTGATLSELQAARAELAKLNGVPACPTLKSRISKGEQQARQLDDLLSSARTALRSCSSSDINAALQSIGGKSKPQSLANAKARLQAQQKVLALVARARAANNAGQYDRALALLNRARTVKAGASRDCPLLGQRIDGAIASVQKKQGEKDGSARVAAATRSCNMTVLKSFVPGYGGITKAMKTQIDDAIMVCRAKEQDRKVEQARIDAGKREAYCRDKFGDGYRPTKPDSNDTYYCLPNQRVANAWCNDNNPGRGWKAVKFNGKGGYSCSKGRKQRVADARADCRRQARAAGKVYAYTKMRKNGTYDCRWCDRGYKYRKGKCYPRKSRTVWTCPKGYILRGRTCYPRQNDGAAAAAAIGAIINSLSRGAGGGGGSANCATNPLAANC